MCGRRIKLEALGSKQSWQGQNVSVKWLGQNISKLVGFVGWSSYAVVYAEQELVIQQQGHEHPRFSNACGAQRTVSLVQFGRRASLL